MKVFATLSISVVLLYTWSVLGSAVYDHNHQQENGDADAAYQPENDAGHVAYMQALHDCNRKCTKLIAQLEGEKFTGVTVPRLDMERCMQIFCDEFNAYG